MQIEAKCTCIIFKIRFFSSFFLVYTIVYRFFLIRISRPFKKEWLLISSENVVMYVLLAEEQYTVPVISGCERNSKEETQA